MCFCRYPVLAAAGLLSLLCLLQRHAARHVAKLKIPCTFPSSSLLFSPPFRTWRLRVKGHLFCDLVFEGPSNPHPRFILDKGPFYAKGECVNVDALLTSTERFSFHVFRNPFEKTCERPACGSPQQKCGGLSLSPKWFLLNGSSGNVNFLISRAFLSGKYYTNCAIRPM